MAKKRTWAEIYVNLDQDRFQKSGQKPSPFLFHSSRYRTRICRCKRLRWIYRLPLYQSQGWLIYALGNGHFTIVKTGFLTHGKLDPVRYLLSEAETQTIKKAVQGFSAVVLVTPQLYTSGLLSNGEVSTIFIAAGRVPSDLRVISSHAKGTIGRLSLFTGKPLEDDISYGIGVSAGLAEQLKLDIGSNTIVMAPLSMDRSMPWTHRFFSCLSLLLKFSTISFYSFH